MPRRPKLWHYTYYDLIDLTGRSENTIHQAASRGSRGHAAGFDPEDFKSVVLWIFRNATDEFKLDIMGEMRFFRDPEKVKRLVKKRTKKR